MNVVGVESLFGYQPKIYPTKEGKYTLTKSESKALYDKYCQSSSNYVGELRDFIVPIFPYSGNNSLADNQPTVF